MNAMNMASSLYVLAYCCTRTRGVRSTSLQDLPVSRKQRPRNNPNAPLLYVESKVLVLYVPCLPTPTRRFAPTYSGYCISLLLPDACLPSVPYRRASPESRCDDVSYVLFLVFCLRHVLCSRYVTPDTTVQCSVHNFNVQPYPISYDKILCMFDVKISVKLINSERKSIAV
jgi:hypothetical protein